MKPPRPATALLVVALALSAWPVVGGRPAGAADPPAARTLRVLSYNIHHGEGVDAKLDLERIAGVIRSARPDLVALQEVDRKTRRTGGVDQAARLGELTGLHAAFGKSIDHEGGEYGNAVLSARPLAATKVHRLPNDPGHEQRTVLEARVRPWDGGPELVFFATHLDHRGAELRQRQAEAINRLAADLRGPAVLAGDLNARPDSAPMRTLLGAWKDATAGPNNLTMPARAPAAQIDYVLVRPAGRFRVTEAKVLAEAVASDHRPILAVVELTGE